MDRLVCGDVGFGKTEVALRAAFVTAMAGMQVALVCPTTLLARQHYTNFVERLPRLPDRDRPPVAAGPGGRSEEDQGGARERAQVDIVIGTHALLGKGVEVQEAGPGHRRRGAAFRRHPQGAAEGAQGRRPRADADRDADPAHAADGDVGLRELSVIQTPPVDRLAVRTYVTPWDPVVVREALLREHYRGGQSFFVVPRVADLPDMEEWLREEVPEVKAITAHGQMSADRGRGADERLLRPQI